MLQSDGQAAARLCNPNLGQGAHAEEGQDGPCQDERGAEGVQEEGMW